MNAQQIAHELGVTERTVRRWVSDGRLPATRNGRELVIDLDAARALGGSRHVVAEASAKDARVEMLENENAWLRSLVELFATGGRSVVPGGHRELASPVNDPAKRASVVSEAS